MEKNEKIMQYIIIGLLVIIIVILLVKDFKKEDKANLNDSNVKQVENKMILSETEVKKYQALVSSTEKSTVYKNSKTFAKDLSDEQKVLNVIKYMLITGEASGNEYIKTDLIKNKVESIYKTKITKLPEELVSKNSYLRSDFILIDDIYALNETYDGKYSYLENETLFVDKAEKEGNNVYLYEKLIVNIDLGESGCGDISKLDGSSKVNTYDVFKQEQCPTDKELYNKYPEYYTTFKHTFKLNGNNIEYISSEIVD